MSETHPVRLLVVISLLHFATHLYTIFLAPLNPTLKDFFGLTDDRDVTFFQAVYLMVYAGSNLAAGVLSTRLSPRLLLTAGPLINGLAVMGMALLTPAHYAGMCALTALGALGGGLYHPVANLLLTEAFPHQKGRALGYVGIGASLAFTAGPWSAEALVYHAGWSWQMVTVLFGAIGLLCAAGAWLFVPGRKVHAEGSPLRPVNAASASAFRPILAFTALALVVMGGREIASWGSAAITPLFMKQGHGLEGQTGFLMAMIFAPGLVIQPLAGRWSDTLGRERVLFAAMVLMAVSLYAIPHTKPEHLFAPYLLLGTGMLATIPTFEALIADRTPVAFRGLVFGLVITAGIGIGAAGPWMTGALADAGGRTLEAYARGWHAMAALTALCAILTGALQPLARWLKLLPAAVETQAPQPLIKVETH